MAYELGDADLDRRIKQLVTDVGEGPDGDLVTEMVVTALKLNRDGADRGDLKLINAALKEMRYSSLVFSQYRGIRKVAVFGSARTTPGHSDYQMAADFARRMTEDRGWMVVTGAGPGIMEAANAGAGPEGSFGVNIRLPFEAEANPHVLPDRLINFKYFFTRKLIFVKESHAFALFPGGFGTMDETFELLTLVQTGKSDLNPIVLIQGPDSGYWQTWVDFVERDLIGNGLIAPTDMHLFTLVEDVEEACEVICRFYANFHSQRFVEGRLVLRLQQAPSPQTLRRLNEEFSDIVVDGEIETIEATPQEVADDDHPTLPRVALDFNRRSFGRLRLLVDRLNDLVA